MGRDGHRLTLRAGMLSDGLWLAVEDQDETHQRPLRGMGGTGALQPTVEPQSVLTHLAAGVDNAFWYVAGQASKGCRVMATLDDGSVVPAQQATPDDLPVTVFLAAPPPNRWVTGVRREE